MSSSNPGYEDGDDPDEICLFYPPLPPHLEPPSTCFLGVAPSSAPAVMFPQQDFNLFLDDYPQNHNPNPLLEDFLITHQRYQQAIELGQGQGQEQRRGKGEGPTQTSSTSLLMMIKQKKMDHNAKERVRRLHLKSGYMALRSLLPDQSHKPKKKWSAPYLIDRAVNHIPQLEIEIEKLKSKKKDLLTKLEKVHELSRAEEAEKRDKILSVSINEVKKGKVIIQVCHQRNQVDIFSELLDKLECEAMEVLDASVYDSCEDRFCHHIHVQMDESSIGADYVAELKEKLVTWLS